jgi:CheY-like chemotaxis protein/integral membrane sensor domain MASE1
MLADPASPPPLLATARIPVLAGIALAYFGAGKLGLYFASINASASPIWPPTGIALAALLLFGSRAWVAILPAAFAVNVTTSGVIAQSAFIAVGNTLEALAGAWLVSRLARGAACFERARDVFRFAGLAGASATLSATVGMASLINYGEASPPSATGLWLTWWLGDVSGALVFTAPLVLWFRDPRIELPDKRLAEAVATLALVMLVGAVCFATPALSGYRLTFLCLPPLAWVAFRFGPRAVATHVALLSLIAVYTTTHGVGPFVLATRNESLLVLQSFMATIALTMLPIAALAAENARVTRALEEANLHERRARAEAEAASRAKDDFMGLLSHELRNPLQAIASSIWVLERNRPDGAGSRAVDIVRRQSDHLARVVNELLDVARRMGNTPPPRALSLSRRDAANEPGDPRGTNAEPRRVLIVDDNADVRLALRSLLEGEGHAVHEAGDGAAGIAAATRLQPDVVLVDIGMPGLDGYDVAKRLRGRFPRMRLVALTGYGQSEDRRRARSAGFDEHLVKPVEPSALSRALEAPAATGAAHPA